MQAIPGDLYNGWTGLSYAGMLLDVMIKAFAEGLRQLIFSTTLLAISIGATASAVAQNKLYNPIALPLVIRFQIHYRKKTFPQVKVDLPAITRYSLIKATV